VNGRAASQELPIDRHESAVADVNHRFETPRHISGGAATVAADASIRGLSRNSRHGVERATPEVASESRHTLAQGLFSPLMTPNLVWNLLCKQACNSLVCARHADHRFGDDCSVVGSISAKWKAN
jgi:hypothetical protein